MKNELERVSLFTPDGRLKTGAHRQSDAVSPFERTGELKTRWKTTVDNVSKIDRVTGLPKGA